MHAQRIIFKFNNNYSNLLGICPNFPYKILLIRGSKLIKVSAYDLQAFKQVIYLTYELKVKSYQLMTLLT